MLTLERADQTLPAATDIPLSDLLAACDAQTAVPMVFTYAGWTIQRGYHITEVKAGQFAALDCCADSEAGSETFIQLWDLINGGSTRMTAGKFAAIIRKVSEHVGLGLSALDLRGQRRRGAAPLQLHCAGPQSGEATCSRWRWRRARQAASHAIAGLRQSSRKRLAAARSASE